MTTTTNADLEREDARNKTNGEFGEKTQTTPDISLTADTPTPVWATIRFEKWEGNQLEIVGSQDIDIRAILDDRDLDSVDPYDNEDDDILFEAVRRGLLPAYDGPFTVTFDIESCEEYKEARREAGDEDYDDEEADENN
jgi:hypothetical protein